MVLPASRRIPRVLRYSGVRSAPDLFVYGAVTPFGCAFHRSSTKVSSRFRGSSTPTSMLVGLASFPFARRYSENRFCFLFLRVLRCFSSPGALGQDYGFILPCPVFRRTGSPIRISTDLCSLAAPRGFSQLAASFVGVWRLGIHPVLFVA